MNIRNCKLILAALVAAVCSGAIAVEDLILAEDTTIDVASGTQAYGLLGGTGFKLTKTGAGTLTFTCVTNETVEIDVREGGIAFTLEDASAVTAKAVYHLDAAETDTMTLVSDGETTYVTQWDDANGSGRFAENAVVASGVKWMKPADERRPMLRPAYQNGLPVVDFGAFQVQSFTNELGETLGYGAAMDLSDRQTVICEAIILASETEELKNVKQTYPQVKDKDSPFVGDTATGNTYHFLRGDFVQNKYARIVLNNPNAKAQYGSLFFDGASVSPTLTGFEDGFHVLDFVPTDALTVGAIARDRSNSFGGKRVAEILLFTTALTAEDRGSVYRRLKGKWFPARIGKLTLAEGTALSLDEGVHLKTAVLDLRGGASVSGAGDLEAASIVGETESRLSFPAGGVLGTTTATYLQSLDWQNRLLKTGSGTLTVAELPSAEALVVSGGVFRVDALKNRKTWFHVDASDSTKRTDVSGSDTTYVTKLSDVDGKNRSASATTQALAWLVDPSQRRPILRSKGQNGLDIVDFGMQQVAALVDDQSKPIGYGAAMDWSECSTTMRDVFVVAGRHETTKTLAKIYTQLGSNTSAAPFVGSKSQYHFLGGSIVTSGLASPNLLYPNPNAYAHKGVVTIDGAAMPTNVNGYLTQEYPEGLHVVNFIPDVDLEGWTFARDRNNSFGGVLLGETMVFTNRVSETVRERIRKSLQVKWLASGDYPAYAYSDLVVAAGAAFELPHAELSVSGTLVPDGDVCVGKLTLVDGASVRLDVDEPESLIGTEFRLVECDVVSLDPKKVTVTGNLAEKTRVRLVAGADGLYARVKTKGAGLMLIFR